MPSPSGGKVANNAALQHDADHHQQYLLHGHSLQHAGCVAKPLLHMAREHILMCIVHCIILGVQSYPFPGTLLKDGLGAP